MGHGHPWIVVAWILARGVHLQCHGFTGSDMEISKNLGVEGGECRSVVR